MTSKSAAFRAAIAVAVASLAAHRASAQSLDVLRNYRFIPSDTVVHVTGGGIPGYDLNLTIAGRFGLVTETGPAATPTSDGTARFVNVHGILFNPLSAAPLPVPGWDLDQTLNLSGLKGFFSPDENHLNFFGADGEGVALHLQATITGKWLQLIGSSMDPPNRNAVLYQVNALAHLAPFPDFNADGAVTTADLQLMSAALADPQSYMAAHSLTPDDIASIGDLDGDGSLTNADLQVMLNLLIHGDDSSAAPTAVPEPATCGLLAIGGLILLLQTNRLFHRRPRASR
jgi:hypothetical protein